jgi:hypothetical protein
MADDNPFSIEDHPLPREGTQFISVRFAPLMLLIAEAHTLLSRFRQIASR